MFNDNWKLLMRTLPRLILLFLLLSFGCFGQTKNNDTESKVIIDTIKIVGDSTFVTVRQYQFGKLILQQDQINLKVKATSTNCNGDSGIAVSAYRSIFHGHSIHFYANGQKRCEGSYKFGSELDDWKYWDENGNVKPKPICDEHIKRPNAVIYVDGIKLDPCYCDEKNKKSRKK